MVNQQEKLVEQLIENSIELQNKTVELISKMNVLIKSVDTMFGLFQEAAQYIRMGKVKDPLISQLSELLEQNKSIAKGLVLLEQYIKDKRLSEPSEFAPRPLPKTKF